MLECIELAKRSLIREVTLAFVAFIVCACFWLVFGLSFDSSFVRLGSEDGVTVVPEAPLDAGNVFALDGPWQVYWGSLLSPDVLAGPNAPEPTGALRFPGSWRELQIDGQRLPDTGVATFRLRLKPPEGDKALTLRLFDLRLAYRLWADGKLIAQSGELGRDAASERPDRSLVLAPFRTTGEPVDLVLQLSNHQFRAGGVGAPILLAKTGVLQVMRDRTWIYSAFFCGVLLVAGIYHLLLHSLRSADKSFLYFGIYALLTFGYAANSNSTYWLSRPIVPEWISSPTLEELSLICYAISGTILFRFYRTLFPSDFSKYLQHMSDIRPVVFIGSEFFLSPVMRSWLVVLLMFAGLLFTTYFLARLVLCVWRGRPGAILLLFGAILLAAVSIHDILVHAGMVEGDYLVLFGLFSLAVFQSSALALRYAWNFEAVETLSADLGRNVDVLKKEMSKRRELEAEVVRISEDERRRVSYQVHDGLCQQLTAARLRFSMLSGRDGDEASSAMTELGRLLSAATEDAYALSRGLWPVEHDSTVAGPDLAELVESVRKASDIEINFNQGQPCENCTDGNLGVLYRIAQEALTNAVRHAAATRIDVTMNCLSGDIELEVRDNGVGPSKDVAASGSGGLGLRIMTHRANTIGAELDIQCAESGGTIVRCRAHCLRHGQLAGGC